MAKTVEHEINPQQTHGFESVSGDREYTSEVFTKLHNALSLGGYASNDAGHLDVSATGSDKIVTVDIGTAFVAGHFLQLKNTHDISLNDAPANQIRYDLIAIRVDRSSGERKISIIKIEGNATATDSTAAIPWDQLQNDDLLLNAGIFEFPIAAVKTSGTANITQDRIFKTLPSVNPLEPLYVILDDTLGTTAQIGGRILIPNEPPTNTPHEITLRVRIPETTSTKDLALVINDFKGNETLIPVLNQSETQMKAVTLSGQSIFITIDAEKTKAITQTPLEVYDVKPLTTQVSSVMEKIDLSNTPLKDITTINSITIHKDRIYFASSSQQAINTSSTYVADIKDDGTFENFRNAINSTITRQQINQITFLNEKTAVLSFSQGKAQNNISNNLYTLQDDGTLTHTGGFNYDPDNKNGLNSTDSNNRGLTIHNGKLYSINDTIYFTTRYDIDENLKLTNGVRLWLSIPTIKTNTGWRSIKFINNRLYFINKDPSKCLTTTEEELYNYDFGSMKANNLDVSKYITDKSELRAMEYYQKLNRIYYWNSVDKILTYSKQIDIVADSPIITEAMGDAKYAPKVDGTT